MKKKINQLRSLKENDFMRHNAIFFVGSVAMGALNYLYYPILGRLLKPAEFGEVQTLVSLFVQIAIFLTVLGMLTVNIVANSDHHKKQPEKQTRKATAKKDHILEVAQQTDEQTAQQTVLELEKLGLFISVLGLIAVVALGPILERFFKFDDTLPFIVLAIALIVSVPATFRSSYLRGKQLFGLTSIAGLVGSGSKLIFSVILILAGFGTTGAIVGLVLSQIVNFIYAAVKARQNGFKPSLRNNFFKLPDMKLIVPELKYAMLVLVGSLVITALYSIDIIAVKHYFDAHTAGLYAGIATVARIIFFLTGSISQVLMPAIKLSNPPGENKQTLLKSTYLLGGIGGAAVVVFCVAPKLIIQILMGKEYLPYANLLPRLSIVIFAVSLLNLFILYYMALREYAIAIIAILGLAVTCGLVAFYHISLQNVVDSMLYGTLATFVMLGMWVGYKRTHPHANDNATTEQTI